MQANLKLSAAVLGALLCTVAPAVTHAESQLEWFQRQLQMTDGYIPQASTPALKKSDDNTSRTDTKAANGGDAQTKAGNTQMNAEDKSGAQKSE